jgi:hypothetical protein
MGNADLQRLHVHLLFNVIFPTPSAKFIFSVFRDWQMRMDRNLRLLLIAARQNNDDTDHADNDWRRKSALWDELERSLTEMTTANVRCSNVIKNLFSEQRSRILWNIRIRFASHKLTTVQCDIYFNFCRLEGSVRTQVRAQVACGIERLPVRLPVLSLFYAMVHAITVHQPYTDTI